MAKRHLLIAAGLAALMAAPAHAGETVEIRNFIGTITLSNGPLDADVTENASNVDIDDDRGLTIDGGIADIDGRKCESGYGGWSIDWFGRNSTGQVGGYEDLEDYPVIDLTLPSDTDLVIRNAVIFTQDRADLGSADLELNHCGSVTLGDVGGPVKLSARGSADLDFGDAEAFTADMRGSGDVDGGDIGDIKISARGSGDVELGDVGSVAADLRGSGDLELGDVTGDMAVSSRGSGDIDTGTVRGDFVYIGNGSGDLEVGDLFVDRAEIEANGSGDIDIEDGEIGQLTLEAYGSATIEIGATVRDADVKASGSADVRIERVTGTLEQSSSGSAEIEVDDRD